SWPGLEVDDAPSQLGFRNDHGQDAVVGLADGAGELLDGGDLAPVHLEDDLAGPDAGAGGGRVGPDGCDDGAVALLGDGEADAVRTRRGGLRRRPFAGSDGAQLDIHGRSRAVADDVEPGDGPWRQLGQRGLEVAHGRDLAVADPDDDVAELDAGAVRRTVRLHVDDLGAFGGGEAVHLG